MAKLSLQLQYFVNKKITEDANWRDVKVVLSGHDVPGEGEHKIMEYIRHAKAQPGYDANTRHCMYGLDADLIMLGLLSHDPHFALLREEVKFGPVRKSRGPKWVSTPVNVRRRAMTDALIGPPKRRITISCILL
jgi:5'-3' exoribonuclease 1